MQGFNHIAGGVCFTGIFCSFHDVNVFEKPEYIALTVGMSLLPDIDHTRSIIGKMVYPLAKWISVKFGHRTITHSLVFYLAVVALVNGSEWLLLRSTSYTYTLLTAYALLSHLIFDMCTRQGIPFFYPFSSRPCVLPANPELRLRANDLRSEAIVFVVFCMLNLFSYDLMANGFWASYNQKFLNYDHIQRESKRKGDLLEVRFLDLNKDTVRGVLIHHTETEFVAYTSPPTPLPTERGEKGTFKTYEVKDCQFLDFRHSGRVYRTRNVQVFDVAPDSLKVWLKLPLIKMQIQSASDLNYFEGAVMKTGKSIDKEFIQGFDFFVEKKDNSAQVQEIEILEIQIASKRREYDDETSRLLRELHTTEAELRTGNSNYNRLSDYEKGQWIKESKDLESQMKALKREIDRKPSLDLQDDYLRLDGLKRSLKDAEIRVSGNLVVWI
jgi:inner membrane protein